MTYREIFIEKIDLKDETFRISEEIESARLVSSLREVGLVHPVVLAEGDGAYRIVCGFRRLHALQRLNETKVWARVLLKESARPLPAFEIAVWDNLSHRTLEPLETARIIFKLKKEFGLPDESLIRTYLPRLGLPAHEQVLRMQLILHASPRGIRKSFREGRLTLASMERLTGMPFESQETTASLMGKIRLSASLQRKFLDLLEDLAAMRNKEPADILRDPEVAAALGNDPLPSCERGETVYGILYRMRYPKVARAREQFEERKKSLKIPGAVRISTDPYFETPGLHVAFTVRDAEEFRKLADDISEATRRPELDRLFEIS